MIDTPYLQYRAADIVSRLLPRRLAYGIGLRMADVFFRRDVPGRLAVMSNLDHVLRFRGESLSKDALEKLARKTFRYFAKYVVDFFTTSRMTRQDVEQMVTLEHLDYLDEARKAGRGVLAVTAHFGSWEIGGAALSALGYPMNVVVLPMPDARTNALFQSQRQRRGLSVAPLGVAARRTLEALRREEFVAMLADRDYSPHHTLCEFFGAPARLPLGPARMSVAAQCPIVPGFLMRRDDDSFLLRMHPPVMPGGKDSVAEVQRQLCRVLEEEIGPRPWQWFVFDDFWSSNGRSARREGA